MSKKLSPQAQAVLNTAARRYAIDGDLQDSIAAALRAATDQAAPSNYESFTGHVEWDQGMEARNDAVRESLLALANELDGGTQ